MLRKIIGRNMKIYFRDHVAVFFSLLAVIIVIALYILFLSDLQVDAINTQMQGRIDENEISYLINSWILAGLLSITCVTSTLGALGTMVKDRESKIIMDFKSLPLEDYVYPIASIVTAVFVGTIISIISLAIYSVFIYVDMVYCFSIIQIGQAILNILFSSFMSASLMGFIVSFFSTNSAFSSASLIVGTTIGFLNGLYVPMGSLPEYVQAIIKCLPFGHIASVFRKILMSDSIAECFSGADSQIILDYEKMYGVTLIWNEKMIEGQTSVIYIGLIIIVSVLLMFVNYGRKVKQL